MQSTRNLIRLASKFCASMKCSHNSFKRGFFCLRMFIHWNTTAVITHLDFIVCQEAEINSMRITRHCFVERVIHNLPNKMVQTVRTGRSNVHSWTLSDRIQSFQNNDIFSSVFFFFYFLSCHDGFCSNLLIIFSCTLSTSLFVSVRSCD